eukprot:4661376-Pleurochrysis_carterae.AAC.1
MIVQSVEKVNQGVSQQLTAQWAMRKRNESAGAEGGTWKAVEASKRASNSLEESIRCRDITESKWLPQVLENKNAKACERQQHRPCMAPGVEQGST